MCVNQWYEGTDGLLKSCPLCRADRGYADTMRLHGLDEVFTLVAESLQQQGASAEEQ